MGKRGNGESSVTRRKDGRWWGRHTVHTPEGSKQRAVYRRTHARRLTQEVARMVRELGR